MQTLEREGKKERKRQHPRHKTDIDLRDTGNSQSEQTVEQNKTRRSVNSGAAAATTAAHTPQSIHLPLAQPLCPRPHRCCCVPKQAPPDLVVRIPSLHGLARPCSEAKPSATQSPHPSTTRSSLPSSSSSSLYYIATTAFIAAGAAASALARHTDVLQPHAFAQHTFTPTPTPRSVRAFRRANKY